MVDGAMAMGFIFMLFSADDGSESDLSAGTYLVPCCADGDRRSAKSHFEITLYTWIVVTVLHVE